MLQRLLRALLKKKESTSRDKNRAWCQHRAPHVREYEGSLEFLTCSVCGTILDVEVI